MGTPLARLRSSLHSSLRLPVDNSKLMQTNKCIGRQAQEESSYWLLRAAHQTPAMIILSLRRAIPHRFTVISTAGTCHCVPEWRDLPSSHNQQPSPHIRISPVFRGNAGFFNRTHRQPAEHVYYAACFVVCA